MELSTFGQFNPASVGTIHFIGIGGIGMSGIAEILHNLGFKIQGSDLSENANVARLRRKGILIYCGHEADNITNVSVVVRSTAVQETNPEVVAAREASIPVIKRAEMLAELMHLKTSIAIAGTHGKTTTTSLVACLFEQAELDPTVINGGIINAHATNAYLGSGEYLIAEADESDGTFIRVPATIAVVTNMDEEHLDYYGSFSVLREAFHTFIQNIPFYGFAVLCADHPEVAQMAKDITDRKILTYGTTEKNADVVATNIRQQSDGTYYNITLSERLDGTAKTLEDIYLPVPGMHNVQNSLAAITIALALGFEENVIINGFRQFKGVKRRFTNVGCVDDITIIDDYAHHPKEIAVTIQTARRVLEQQEASLIVVIQPHRYSRVQHLFNEFIDVLLEADHVVVTDIYAAGEAPISGAEKEDIVAALEAQSSSTQARTLNAPDELAHVIADIAKPGDMVLCLGAGNITSWAHALPETLRAIRGEETAPMAMTE